MLTTHATADKATDAEELPANWTETDHNHFEHTSGAVVRVRREIPLRSAAECNAGTHSEGSGVVTVLYHSEPLPSAADPVHRGGTEADARAAALEFINTGER